MNSQTELYEKQNYTDAMDSKYETRISNIDSTAIIKDIRNFEKVTVPHTVIAVYCGSRLGKASIYAKTAKQLGKALAKNQIGLVYGGGNVGLMGELANCVIHYNGYAIGVIPIFMLNHEKVNEDLTVLHITYNMHTRKAIMADYSDAFITLPGGLGTLEEMLEVATWNQLNRHNKLMILLNIDGYYDNLIEQLKSTIKEGFMKDKDLERLVICNDVDEMMATLKDYF